MPTRRSVQHAAPRSHEGFELAPYADFTAASGAVLDFLHAKMGFTLWMVTRIRGTEQVVLAVRDDEYGIRRGDVFPWQETLCFRMVPGLGPHVAPRTDIVPVYAAAEMNRRFPIGAYVGVPLVDPDGDLFGTLCAYDPRPQPAVVAEELPFAFLLARMLGGVLANEIKSEAEARRAERAEVEDKVDPLTGLANRSAWRKLLAAEEERCALYGHSASVIVIDLDGVQNVNVAQGQAAGDELISKAGAALRKASRGNDLVARLDGDSFGIVAVNCDLENGRRLVRRLERALVERGVAASIGLAVRDPQRGLSHAWLEADEAMRLRKQNRTARRGVSADEARIVRIKRSSGA